MISMQRHLLLLLSSAYFLASTPLLAHDGGGKESHTPLMQQALSDAKGKQVTMLTVNYEPGATSDAHIHPGSVFAYVLEGAVVSQLEGQPERTYRKGQSWYEPPRTGHLVSRNASDTQPAALLVVAITDQGEPIKLPLAGSGPTASTLPRLAHP